eukprot:gb/GEZN01020483.1/.p1 GENE.gb/GEZN01020483.1/~~gb/GEZN01020483.1/.p1  ORF type:complete len:186 (+),score=16.45 gb/GEZN01020483.1/:67-624(+)
MGKELLSFVLTLCWSCTGAYRFGEAVSMLKRSQYREFRSDWNDMSPETTPRFGLERVVKFEAADVDTIEPTEPFKISFSIAEDHLLVPWITVNDGKGHRLRHVAFTFVMNGAHVERVRTVTEYHPSGSSAHDIHFSYSWVEKASTRMADGLVVLVWVSVIVAWVAMAFACYISDNKTIAGRTKVG